MTETVSSKYAPTYVLKAKSWTISLALLLGAIVVASVVGGPIVYYFDGDLAIVLRTVASSLGMVVVIGLYLYQTDLSLAYVDFPGLSARALGTGVLFGLGLTALQAALTALFLSQGIGSPVGPVGQLVSRRGVGFLATMMAVNVLVVAPAEELFHRNGIQKILARSHTELTAVVGAALLFSAPHMISYVQVPVDVAATSFVQVLINGLLYGFAYARWERVDVPAVAHAVYNCGVFLFAYFHVLG
ncbi:CPBP family intramembrane glutamic endopeptidase [Halomicrobium urmianum]|uniref:CPBP family intramembrane glutamic endopeptidase n=1 Tax=Halomicrobium urmianum TaxID=1586233 RepID=UPI001CD92CFC|nr:type II CAAX endopeptidase family protein [Halomicrobium urmianum]